MVRPIWKKILESNTSAGTINKMAEFHYQILVTQICRYAMEAGDLTLSQLYSKHRCTEQQTLHSLVIR